MTLKKMYMPHSDYEQRPKGTASTRLSQRIKRERGIISQKERDRKRCREIRCDD
jgi:hypothetical protein